MFYLRKKRKDMGLNRRLNSSFIKLLKNYSVNYNWLEIFNLDNRKVYNNNIKTQDDITMI